MNPTGRERIRAFFDGEKVDRCGFWLGDPHSDTWPILHKYFGISNEEDLRKHLGDDVRWVQAGEYPDRQSRFPRPDKQLSLEEARGFDPGSYPWPDPRRVDYSKAVLELRSTGEYYRIGGMWNTFYHDVMNLFGLENYMALLHLEPQLVQEVTRRVSQFYLETNDTFFQQVAGELDAYFFGNDFGTQQDLMISPEAFDTFILPSLKLFTEHAHSHGLKVFFHSCGSVYRIIDRLIDIGVDCLHPIQARAESMDADTLRSHFGGKICFMGGIDTQDLLVNASPDEVRTEVDRVRSVLGPNLIISPSHEALLPNVPPENVNAMALEATRILS